VVNEFKLAAVAEFVNKMGPGLKSAGKDLGSLGKTLDTVKKAIAGAAIVTAGKAAYELSVLGAQSLRTKHAFEMISGGAEDASENLDAMRRATRGAMSEQAMMASSNRLMQMGLANNASELENITTMATRLGAAMGKEAGPAVEEFALMLANQSIPRLDTFGISAGKVRARMEELQKATPGLTREMAFMTAVNEEGAISLDRLGESADDELLANERLEASMEDLKMIAAEALAPAMAKVADVLVTVAGAAIDAQEEIQTLRDRFGDAAVDAAATEDNMGLLSDATRILAGEVMGAGEELYQAGSAMESLRHQATGAEIREAAWAFQEAREEARLLTPAIAETTGAFDGLSTSAKTVAGSFGEMTFDDEQLWKMAMASGATTEALAALAQHLGIATEAEIQNTLESYRLTELFGQGALTAEQYAAGISALETATIQAAGGFEGLSNDAAMAEKGLDAMQVAQEEAITATRDMSSRYGESEADFAAAEAARTKAIESARDMRLAEEEAAEATENMRDAEEQATSKAEGLDDKVRALTAYGFVPMSEAAADAELKTLGLRDEMGLARDVAFEFGENISLANDVLKQIEGDYYVNVHYASTGSVPSAPPGSSSPPPSGHQSGTMFHRGGWALIGERGPELVALPRGSQVWPTSSPQSRAAVNNRYNYGGDTIYINDRLAAALYLESRRRDRMQRIENM